MKTATETADILDALEGQHPDADTELNHSNAFELLVATILSAQSTDQGVNRVTPALFKKYPNAHALARATTDELEPQIHATGFFRAKSRALIGMAQALVREHGGKVPASMDALLPLPGVGRKTANVVLGHALGVPGLPVDRHVLRVANRLGIADADDPVIVEQQLCARLPPARWTRTSDTLILHGRRICKPKPLCDQCAVQRECDYFQSATASEATAATRRAPGKSTAGAKARVASRSARPMAAAGVNGTGAARRRPRVARPTRK